MIGRVTSDKLNKTVTVLVERIAVHPIYKKTFKRSKNYLVHDELGAKEGDMVDIVKVKPISKNKHWAVKKIIGQNIAEVVKEHLKEEAEEMIAEVMPEEKIEEVKVKEAASEAETTKVENDKKEVKASKSKKKK